MTRSKEERLQSLVEILQRDEQATVAGLASEVDVTEMTIRRDLEALEQDGVLERFHGGARLVVRSSYEPPLALREKLHTEDKRAIARAVAAEIVDGDTVILDGGSTGIAIANALRTRRITVCPLSLRVAWVFEQSPSVALLMPPGAARRGELSLSGSDTVDYLRRHHFDQYVLTASGFSLSTGLTEWNVDDAAVKRAALVGAKRTIAAIDASKFERDAFARTIAAIDASKFERDAFADICDLATPAVLVVAGAASPKDVTALRAATTSLVIAR